jgi:hypothetical protein
MPKLLSRHSRNPRRRRNPGTLSIFVAEDIGIATGDTASNDTVYTNSAQSNQTFSLQPAYIDHFGGSTITANFYILRRVPSGYANPSITPATGLTSFIDTPDVLAYASHKSTSAGAVDPFLWIRVKPTIVLSPGDRILLQAVASSTSTGNSFTTALGFRLRSD